MAKSKNAWPECDSEEFISQPNQYEVYEFNEGYFVTTDNHFIDEYEIYCRECSSEVDVQESNERKRIVLKT